MMRFLLPLLLIAASAPVAQAQKSHIGIKAGPSAAWIQRAGSFGNSFGGSYKTKARIGWHAGFSSDYDFSPKLNFRAGLLYTQQGEQYYGLYSECWPVGQAELHEGNLRTEYVVLPLLVQWLVSPRLALQLGPQAGSLLQARYEDAFTTYAGASESRVSNDTISVNPIDLGVVTGVAYEGESGFNLSARYVHGVVDLCERTMSDNQRFNRSLQVAAGYVLQPGRSRQVK